MPASRNNPFPPCPHLISTDLLACGVDPPPSKTANRVIARAQLLAALFRHDKVPTLDLEWNAQRVFEHAESAPGAEVKKVQKIMADRPSCMREPFVSMREFVPEQGIRTTSPDPSPPSSPMQLVVTPTQTSAPDATRDPPPPSFWPSGSPPPDRRGALSHMDTGASMDQRLLSQVLQGCARDAAPSPSLLVLGSKTNPSTHVFLQQIRERARGDWTERQPSEHEQIRGFLRPQSGCFPVLLLCKG